MSEVWAAAAAVAVSAGEAAYSANQQKKAAAQANQTLADAQPMKPGHVPFPQLVNTGNAQGAAIKGNTGYLDSIFNLAGRVNNFQQQQAIRGYTAMQPWFRQLQSQIGQNALSFAKGELPPDVVANIGREAASRGLQNGFGLGAGGAGAGTSLGSLNLRNLGLTSLQLSQQGTDLAMRANQQAAGLTPGLFDPSSMFITPAMQLGVQEFNANAINQANQLNAGYANAAGMQNTALGNAILQSQAQNTLASQLSSANAYASAGQQAGGILQQALQYGYGTNQYGRYNTQAGVNKAYPNAYTTVNVPGEGYSPVTQAEWQGNFA